MRRTDSDRGGGVAGILRETSAIKGYWMEPGSRRVEPQTLAVTDASGKALEKHPYSSTSGLEIRGSAARRMGVLIDFGKEVGGRVHLAFGAGGGRRIGSQAVESLTHLVNPVLAGAASKADPTIKYRRLGSRGEEPLELPHYGGFRYLWLYPELRGRAMLGEVWLDYTPHFMESPGNCGYFLSSDDLLNRAWFAGLHTIEMCTVRPSTGGFAGKSKIGQGDWVLIDGAKRDRLIWTGDIGPMAAAISVSNNNFEAVRDSLASLASSQARNGYIPACSPGPLAGRVVSGFFGDYVAWWVVCLYQYYLHTADGESLAELFPVARKALNYLHSQCRGGLFRQTPLNMMEWCYTFPRLGKPSYTNVMYYWALNSASFLAHELGDDEASVGYISRAYRLSEVIQRELWDEKRRVFVDTTTDRRRAPQDGNSLAIVSGLAGEPQDVKSILEYMRANMWEEWGSSNVDTPYMRSTPGYLPHNKRVVPFMNNYEVLARFMSGDGEGALELIRRCWGNMVSKEPGTTFWEWMGRDGEVDNHYCSLCHGWSAGVVPLLSKYVLGIRPAGVGYSSYRVDPFLGDLDWVEGRVPVPGGFIEVRVEKKKGGIAEVRVRAPKGIRHVGDRSAGSR